MATSGYSGTPLEKKLGIKGGFVVRFINVPNDYFELFESLPEDVVLTEKDERKKDFIHYFALSINALEREILNLKKQIKEDGMIWISWPKKSADIKSDLDGNIVRSTGLGAGLVDIKVCAVNETWSALKFVIPVKDRMS